MRVLIVEDETLAATQLAAMLAQIKPGIEIVAVCDTIESTVQWLQKNPKPNLGFFDIHLGDGLSFEVFKRFDVEMPVIFTTAYDQYAIKAFKVNSVDYLLKPYDIIDLRNAMAKFDKLNTATRTTLPENLMKDLSLALKGRNYKERFLVRIGTRIKAVSISTILYFYSFEKGTYLKTTDGKNYLLDQTLETIEQQVDPALFFRINRKFLMHIDAITEMSVYSNSRLKLKVPHSENDDLLVAREKTKAFKAWFEGDSPDAVEHAIA
jgi:DNA-binding LytR/AlgR family response regulator